MDQDAGCGFIVLLGFVVAAIIAGLWIDIKPSSCDPASLDFRKPGLYRCLTLENGTRDWVRVEEDY